MKERDKLAHWCWGTYAELPNDLVLLKQRYARLLDTTSRVVGQARRFSEEILRRIKRAKSFLEQLALDCLR
jgi:hypothetical protein